ncbi:chemotaxis protein CheD [Bacillus sp. 03113]|uniref:chemotaxis protein CheD n=1 Tax=Bacillus sp. 03113 TaxID=2578211 RepID=UPI0011423FFF|nr:chemotaxis protein CheD [Bacillus sp. 03113]
MRDEVQVIKVGIADMNIVRAPHMIRTTGLGSCVGVVLYDPSSEIAGLAHIMLPHSAYAKAGSINLAKYADTAVVELVKKMKNAGARSYRIQAKLAGGAQMFKFSGASEMMKIGPRNVEAVKLELTKLGISIISEDTGGSNGRTIEFNPLTSILEIRTVNKGIYEI